MVAEATPIMHATPPLVKSHVPGAVAPLGVAWRPLRVVPALHRDHYCVASEHTPGQWYQVYLAILDAAHAHCECAHATYRLNRPDSPLCKHGSVVVDHILDEPAPVAEPEPIDAPTPLPAARTSGSVMDVFRHKRAIAQAIREDKVLPFRRPMAQAAPVCVDCGEPASILYTTPPRCGGCGFNA